MHSVGTFTRRVAASMRYKTALRSGAPTYGDEPVQCDGDRACQRKG